MMKRFLVIKEETCPKCKGEKMVQASEWAEYWTQNPDGHQSPDGSYFDGDAFDRWWRDKGYSYNEIPDEEEICFECQETGVIRSETDLNEIIPWLTENLPKTTGPRVDQPGSEYGDV